MYLLLFKIAVSVIVVFILAEISKRVNPILAGVLNGLPLGVGLSVYFIALENGILYISKGIPWGIAGLSSAILFCLIFFIVNKILTNFHKIIRFIIASISAAVIFTATGFLINLLNLSLFTSIIIFLFVFIINIFILHILKIEKKGEKSKSSKWIYLIIRGVIVSFIIITVTGLGGLLGSRWAGVLSSFPSTLYALIIILNVEQNENLYQPVIYGFSFGVITLVIFYILSFFMFPILGLNISYIIIYILCIIFVFLLNMFFIILKNIFCKKLNRNNI